MGRLAVALVAAAVMATAGAAHAEVVWLCKPGQDDNPCYGSLETTVYAEDGTSRTENPPLAPDAPVDCFYVYPTVSEQPGTNADKTKDDELYAIARYQAARFSQRCRVYAPVYRQLTLLSIAQNDVEARKRGGQLAYGDVKEAWLEYLAKHNGGRPFVLIGHSQGVRMLRQLIREEVDPKPAVRSRLVSAMLMGGNVLVKKGSDRDGDFANVPACRKATQTGCVIAWSTFNEDPPDDSRFGRPPPEDTTGTGFPAGDAYEVVCTNPASLDANERKPVTSILRSERYPGLIGALLVQMYGGPPPSAPTPYLIPSERYTAKCESRANANVLFIESIGDARRLNPAPDDTWGLHLADMNLPLGELVDLVGTQSAAFLADTPPRLSVVFRCSARRVAVRLKGGDAARLARVEVQVGSRRVVDRSKPFRPVITRSQLRAAGGRATVTGVLRDGRRAQLKASAGRCA